MASGATPIVVGVRVRPFNQREARFQSLCVVHMEAPGLVKLLSIVNGQVASPNSSSGASAPREFIFDHAFWTHDKPDSGCSACPNIVFADQQAVYEKMAAPVLQNVLLGFNACLFAYGQTGSGKTYSMMGTPSDRGVLPRLGEELFSSIDQLRRAEQTVCAVEASFCEIYNEKVRDLMMSGDSTSLNSSPPAAASPPSTSTQPVALAIRQDPKRGVFVEGLSKFSVANADDFYIFLEKGLASRAVASTNMNNTSSRSHAIVIVVVTQTGPKGEKAGKLCLVDLAGSERVAATGATGQTATEGQNINLSLTQLGICLKRLAEQAEAAAAANGKKAANALPIPYRDSSLTYLLKENLGGNSKTAMLANISPASVNYEETLATLRFASIARKVKSVATVNENPQTKLILQLRQELAELKDKYQRLEARKSLSVATAAPVAAAESSSAPPVNIIAPSGEGTWQPSRATSTERASLNASPIPDAGIMEAAIVAAAAAPSVQLGGATLVSADSLSVDSADSVALDDDDDEAESFEELDAAVHTVDELRHVNPASPLAPSFSTSRFRLDLSRVNFAVPRQDSGAHHDTDIDDLMLNERSHSVLSADSVDIDVDDVGSSPLTTTPPLRKKDETEIFLDNQKPQLIHLQPDSVTHTNIPLVLFLEEGSNTFTFGDVHMVLLRDALANQVTVFGSPDAIAVNGESIADEGCILRHKDRVVVCESFAFRFSYAAGVVAQEGGFNKNPTSTDHVILLERYFRAMLRLERSRDAMSIAKALLSSHFAAVAAGTQYRAGLAAEASIDSPRSAAAPGGYQMRRVRNAPSSIPLTARSAAAMNDGGMMNDSEMEMGDASDAPWLLPTATPRLTPRSTNPVLAALGDDIAWFNETVYKIEVELAELYPPPPEELVEVDDGRGDAAAYREAIDEVLRAHEAQEQELAWLRSQVHGGSATRLERTTSIARYDRTASLASHGGGSAVKSRSFSRILDHMPHPLELVVDPTVSAFAPPLEPASPLRLEQPGDSVDVVSPPPTAAQAEAAGANHRTDDDVRRSSQLDETGGSLAMTEEDWHFEQSVSDTITTRMVQLELAYHRRVRSIQLFSKGGPKGNALDFALWSRLYVDPPFLGDTALQFELSCYCMVKDNWCGATGSSSTVGAINPMSSSGGGGASAGPSGGSWTHRFVSATRSFLFVFKKADGRERCQTAVYIPGAALSDLNDTDLEVCAACPRNDRDNRSSNAKDVALLLRLKDSAERQLWREWLESHAVPIPMPHHMIKRKAEKRAVYLEEIDMNPTMEGDETNEVPLFGGESTGGAVPSAAVVSLEQVCSTANWKPDHTTKQCEDCKKDFTLFLRRHHCRICGGIFCKECVAKDERANGEWACRKCREEVRLGSPRCSPRSHAAVLQCPKAVEASGGNLSRKDLKRTFKSNTTMSAVAAASCRATACCVVSSNAIPQLETLIEDFPVCVIVESSEVFWPAALLPPDFEVDAIHRALSANSVKQPQLVKRLRVDHYRDRFHTALSDDVVTVARCGWNPYQLEVVFRVVAPCGAISPERGLGHATAVTLPSSASASQQHSTAFRTVSFYFPNAAYRESCLESLVLLLQQRVFINTLVSARCISQFHNADLVVKERDEDAVALLRTTTQSTAEMSVWAGAVSQHDIMTDRMVPFHLKYAVFLVLVSWDDPASAAAVTMMLEKKLAVWGFELTTSVPFDKNAATLLIVIDKQTASRVMGVPAVARCTMELSHMTGDSDHGTLQRHLPCIAVGFEIHETTLLVIASTAVFEGQKRQQEPQVAVETATNAAPSSCSFVPFSMPRRPPTLDPLTTFDHVLMVGAPKVDEFRRCTAGESDAVQSRSLTGCTVAKRAGRTWAQLSVTAVPCFASKLCTTLDARPVIILQQVTLVALFASSQRFPSTTPLPLNVTSHCELWSNFGFDRLEDGVVGYVQDFTESLCDRPDADVECVDAALRSIVVANTLPEYFKARSLFVAVRGLGSGVVFVAALPTSQQEESVTIECELYSGGKTIAVVTTTFRVTWM